MISLAYNVTTHFSPIICFVSYVYNTRGTPAPFATPIKAKHVEHMRDEMAKRS
jgi:hypothetical protein